MPFRNILVQLSTYPVRTPDNVLSAALKIAEMLGGRVTAAICKVDTPKTSNKLAMLLTDLSAAIAEAERDSEIAVRELEDLLTLANAGRYQPIETLTFHWFADVRASGLIGRARLSDLIVVPITPQPAFQDLAQEVIFGSGRPVLLLPANVPEQISLEVVVVAWDGSRVAARAIGDALHFLKFAHTVRLVEITGDKPLDGSSSIAALRDHLLSHDIKAVIDTVPAEGSSSGAALTAYCSRYHADLLVMGAYGHSRIRDFVMGGATQHFVDDTLLPVLLSH